MSSSVIGVRLLGRPQLRAVAHAPWCDLPIKGAALLALLAVDGPTPRAAVAVLLWPDAAGDKPRVNLRGLLRDLRVLAGADVCVGADTLALADNVVHDLSESSISDGALALPGDLLAGHHFAALESFSDWLADARARYRERWRRAIESRAERMEQQGLWEGALAHAELLLERDAVDESAGGLLTRVLYRRGDTPAALAAYARLREALWRKLQTEPGERTRALATSIELGQPLAATPAGQRPLARIAPSHTVARDAELQIVAAAWAHGTDVLMDGEMGVGKSRLVAELLQRHPHARGSVALGGDVDVPFATLTRLLRTLHAWTRPPLPPQVAAELARLVPEFGAAASHRAETAEIVAALAQAFGAWHRLGCRVLVIDDFQWCDAPSAGLLLRALPGGTGPQLTLVCRSGEPAPLAHADDTADRRWQLLTLRPLDAPGIEALLRATSLPLADPPRWALALTQHTLGSPLHVLEVLMALRRNHGDALFAQAIDDMGVLLGAATLRDLLLVRVRRLAPQALHLAQLAAMSGSLFSVPLAREVLQLNDLELADLWAGLEAELVLYDARLQHDGLRELLLETVAPAVACHIHARIAAHAQSRGAPAIELARHWLAAAHWPAAAAACTAAAAEAATLGAALQALQFWDHAATCHDRLGADGAAQQARKAACREALTALPAAEVTERAAALGARATDDAQRFAALLLQGAAAELSRSFPRLLAVGEQAVELADKLRQQKPGPAQTGQRLEAASIWALGLTFSGRADRALAALDAVANDACHAEGRAGVRYFDSRGTTCALLGEVDGSIEAFQQAANLARRAGDKAALQRQRLSLSSAMARSGRYSACLELARESLAALNELGEVRGVMAGIAHMVVGGFCGRLGRYREAIDEMRRALTHFRDSGALPWLADVESHLANIYADLGDLAQARACLVTPAAEAIDHQLVRRLTEFRLASEAGETGPADIDALRTGIGEARLENRLAVDLVAARLEPPALAVQQCRAVIAAAQPHLRALVQHGRVVLVDALRQDGRIDEAADLAVDVMDSLANCQPYFMYVPQAPWAAFQALQAAGRLRRADEALTLAQNWVRREALPHVPPELRDSFLQRNACNRQLLQASAAS